MSDKKLRVAMIIEANSASFKAELNQAKTQWESVKRALTGTVGKVMGIGAGVGAFALVKESAMLDKSLMRIGASAGKTREQVRSLKDEIESMGIKTGQSTENLTAGFSRLYKLTGDWDKSAAAMHAINAATTVTGASAETLAESLAMIANTFNTDLSGGGAMAFLDKLTIMSKGAGGVENVASILNSIAPMAKLAGMSESTTLQLIGMMSQVTKNPEQMGFLAEQTLRMFTNLKSITNKKGKLGGLIFDESGNRRDPLEVLQGIKKMYDTLGEKKQIGLLGGLTGGGDPRALRAIQMLFESPALKSGDDLKRKLEAAAGTLEQRLPKAINNAADATTRLRNSLQHAADPLTEKINDAIARAAGFLLDKKGMTGGQIAGYGTAAALTAWLLGRQLKGGIGRLFSGAAGTAAGVAEGKALQMAAGVTPVFVVNWPGAGGFGGYGGGVAGLPGSGGGFGGMPGGRYQDYINLPGTAGVGGKSSWMKYGGLGVGGSGLARIIGVLGPIGEAAALTYMMEGAISALTNSISGGKYQNYAELILDKLPRWMGGAGGDIGSSNQGVKPPPPTWDPKMTVQVYVDGEKKKPSKTITDARGWFDTPSAVSDATSGH